MEGKETIADICERLRETSDEWDCEKLVEMWGLKCNDFKSCGECGRAFYGGLADRIEAAHQREVVEAMDGGVIRECKKTPAETYTGLTLRYPNPAEMPDGGDASVTSDARSDTSEAVKRLREFALGEVANFMGPNDAEELLSIADRIEASKVMEKINEERRARADEDTREKLEEDIKNTQWCVSLKDILGWLDRQEAITERNCRAEYEDMRDYLQAQVERQRDVIDRFETAYNAVRGLFEDAGAD